MFESPHRRNAQSRRLTPLSHRCNQIPEYQVSSKRAIIAGAVDLAVRHAIVRAEGTGHGIVEQMFEHAGLTHEVILRLPYSLAAPMIVADSDLVVNVPRLLGDAFARILPDKVLPVPVKIPPFQVNQWLRSNFARILAGKARLDFARSREQHLTEVLATRAPAETTEPGTAPGVTMESAMRREIEAECVALSNAFAYHLDHKDYPALVALFAPNGTFIRTGVRLEGPEMILATMRQRPAEMFTRHVTTNFHFTHVGHDTAKAVFYNMSYFIFAQDKPPFEFAPQRMMLLDFMDTYGRTPQGWRFLERDARPLMIPEELRSRLPAAAFSGADT